MKDAKIADVSRAHSLDAVLTLVELTWHEPANREPDTLRSAGRTADSRSSPTRR